jgi:hypothetical protein
MPPTNNHMKVRLLKKMRKKAKALIKIEMLYAHFYMIRRHYRDFTGEHNLTYLSNTGKYTVDGRGYDYSGTPVGPFMVRDLEVAKAKLVEERRKVILELAAKEFLHKQNKQLAKL